MPPAQRKIKGSAKETWGGGRGIVAGGRVGHGPLTFRNSRIFGTFNCLSETYWTFAAGTEKGFKFYRKIFDPGAPTLQVP